MSRHRGRYNPENEEPYELSRSKIEDFLGCPACFYLEKVKGVPFPSGIPFSLNEATDVLFKRDFDRLREAKLTHPYLEKIGYGYLIPFEHPELGKWQDSLHFGAEGRLNTVHESTNLKIGGGLDDVFLNTKTNQLHIVDYKSTSQKTEGREITLNGSWKEGIRRQMDIYVWVLKRKGFDVSNTGFFLYCDGDRFTDYTFLSEEIANMQFKITWLPYEVNLSWIEPCLEKIKDCILNPSCPEHSEGCEYESFLKSVAAVNVDQELQKCSKDWVEWDMLEFLHDYYKDSIQKKRISLAKSFATRRAFDDGLQFAWVHVNRNRWKKYRRCSKRLLDEDWFCHNAIDPTHIIDSPAWRVKFFKVTDIILNKLKQSRIENAKVWRQEFMNNVTV